MKYMENFLKITLLGALAASIFAIFASLLLSVPWWLSSGLLFFGSAAWLSYLVTDYQSKYPSEDK